MNRWPPLLVVILMVAALIALELQRDPVAAVEPVAVDDEDAPLFDEDAEGPRIAAAGASGSTWYCPAGSITPDGSSDHVVIVTNHSDEVARGSLTIYPSLTDTEGNSITYPRAAQSVELEPRVQTEISLAPLVASLDSDLATNTGAFAAALVEFDGAGVQVEHRVQSGRGSDIGACASSASTNWFFSSGTTTADVAYQMYLLNPFPDDAVVDVSFVTDAGTRSPTAMQGRLVPAQSLTVLQVSPEVPVNAQATAHVEVKSGRIIAERIQLFGNEAGPTGLSVSLGSNRLAEQWFFPAGRSVPGAGESYVIYNPGTTPAEVEFEVKPDSADRIADVAPLPVPVGSRQRWIVTVTEHPTHPADSLTTIDATTMVAPGEPYFASVRSFNGVPIVVERILTQPGAETGVTATLGVDVSATNQALFLPVDLPAADSATLAVLNPAGNTISRVDVLVGNIAGERVAVSAELAPRRRGVFDLLSFVQPGDRWIRVRSSTGTMVEMAIDIDRMLLTTTAIPVDGTTSVPDLLTFD